MEAAGRTMGSDELPLFTFALDGEGRFARLSSRWSQTFGIPAAELLRLRLPDLLAEGQAAAWRRVEGRVLRGETVPRFELTLEARSGRPVFVDGSAWPEGDGIAGSLVDVTARREAEQARTRVEESFRRFFERNPAAAFVSTVAGRLLDCNESFVRMLGFASREEALATPTPFHYASRPDRAILLDQLRHSKRFEDVEIRLRRRDGTPIIVLGSVSLTSSPDGGEILEGVGFDITPRLDAERALRQSEARYRSMVENGLGFLCRHDLDGRILGVNPATARALGYKAEHLVGRSLAEGLAPEVRGDFPAYLERVRRGDTAKGMMRVVTRQGEERIWMYRNVLQDIEGGPPEVLGFAIDVTDSRRARDALAASERRYRQLLDASGDLIQSVNAEGRLEYVNPQWATTLGYTAEEARGMSLAELLAPREVDHCFSVFERLQGGEAVRQVETVFVAKEGREVPVEGSLSAIFEDGRFMACQGFFRDVTRSKALEADRQAYLDQIQRQNLELELRRREAERANHLKSEFLATMSHELRTPLNAVMGFSDLLAEENAEPLTPKQHSYLSFVRNGAEHLLRLIDDVLDLSKIEAGRLKLEPETFHVSAVLPEVTSTVGPLAARKEITLEQEVPADLAVFADRLRFKQILFNLLSNAVKFTPAGGVIRVVAEREEGFVLVSVSDTGIGVAPGQHEAIFDEFQQLAGPVGSPKEGTGLGLAIVRRLVEQHGGRVWADNLEDDGGGGSRFTFMLPDREGLLCPPTGPVVLRLPRASSVMPLILLVSDDEEARAGWTAALEAEQYDVRAAGYDGEVLRRVSELGPRLIILDLGGRTPGKGWTVLRDLARLAPGSVASVLALTPPETGKRAAFLAGASGCLLQPVDGALLLQAVRRRVPPLGSPRAILIVDHQPERQRRLTEATLAAGYRPVVVSGGREALQTALRILPFAMVLSLRLPDLEGYQTLLRLRSTPATANLPVLALASESVSLAEPQLLDGPTRLLLAEDGDWREGFARELEQTLSGWAVSEPPWRGVS